MELLDFLKKHSGYEKASFHMPGHKGKRFFERMGLSDFAEGLIDMDVTEIPGADELRHPKNGIREIEEKFRELYGSRESLISVNGASAGIEAAIWTAVSPEHKLLTGSTAHISVEIGAERAGAHLIKMESEGIRTGECMVPGPLDPAEIERVLKEDDSIDTVLVTSPYYFGVVSDIKRIADIVHEAGKVLIVDQAHGAHLKFFDEWAPGSISADSAFEKAKETLSAELSVNGVASRPMSAELSGADIVIDSTHKTLSSFTQSAVVNVMGERIPASKVREKLLNLESTSPSYILMASLAVTADIMEREGEALIGSWDSDLGYFYSEVEKIPGIRTLYGAMDSEGTVVGDNSIDEAAADGAGINIPSIDRSKIVVDFSGLGMTGDEAAEELIEMGIYPEFSSGPLVLFLTGIGNIREDYDVLLEALKRISERHSGSAGGQQAKAVEKETQEILHAPGEMGTGY